MIDASSARASRFAHGFLREPLRGVFAPRSLGTIFSLALGNLGLLVDDPFLSPHFQLGPSASRCHSGLVSLVSSARRMGLPRWRQLFFLNCMLFARQLRFTSSHLFLNLFDSGKRPKCFFLGYKNAFLGYKMFFLGYKILFFGIQKNCS